MSVCNDNCKHVHADVDSTRLQAYRGKSAIKRLVTYEQIIQQHDNVCD